MSQDEHGSNKGYNRHVSAGQKPCDPCRLAHNEYIRDYRAQRRRELADESNRFTAARERALGRLATNHPLEFAALLRNELTRPEAR